MRLDKMTSRLQNALSDSQSLALGKDHSAVETIHLLSVLVEQRDASVLPMLIGCSRSPPPIAITLFMKPRPIRAAMSCCKN